MDELIEILKLHFKKYPLMQPIDAIKLIYQNEFGGGHLISNAEKSLEYLKKEWNSLDRSRTAETGDYIGNGIFRVNLCRVKYDELEALNNIFVSSAERIHGERGSFEQKLEILIKLCREWCAPFSFDRLTAVLDEYKLSGYPIVSHSDIYRENYRPAYRIILTDQISSHGIGECPELKNIV